jgi:hypothetical protein
MTELMPPILSDYHQLRVQIWEESLTDAFLLDLVLLPCVLVLVVEEDGLEDMVLERLGLVELILEG